MLMSIIQVYHRTIFNLNGICRISVSLKELSYRIFNDVQIIKA